MALIFAAIEFAAVLLDRLKQLGFYIKKRAGRISALFFTQYR